MHASISPKINFFIKYLSVFLLLLFSLLRTLRLWVAIKNYVRAACSHRVILMTSEQFKIRPQTLLLYSSYKMNNAALLTSTSIQTYVLMSSTKDFEVTQNINLFQLLTWWGTHRRRKAKPPRPSRLSRPETRFCNIERGLPKHSSHYALF